VLLKPAATLVDAAGGRIATKVVRASHGHSAPDQITSVDAAVAWNCPKMADWSRKLLPLVTTLLFESTEQYEYVFA
jgi:hypothetical protein